MTLIQRVSGVSKVMGAFKLFKKTMLRLRLDEKRCYTDRNEKIVDGENHSSDKICSLRVMKLLL